VLFDSVLLATLDELLPVFDELLSVVFGKLGEAALDEPLSVVFNESAFEKLPLPAGLGVGFACAERLSAAGADDGPALLGGEAAELGADGIVSVVLEAERSVLLVAAEGADPWFVATMPSRPYPTTSATITTNDTMTNIAATQRHGVPETRSSVPPLRRMPAGSARR
jgi:hypothetical protein